MVPEIVIGITFGVYLSNAMLSSRGLTGSLEPPALWFGPNPEYNTITIIYQVIGWALQGLSIYLVIIWSRQHNRQFDQPNAQVE